jgi:tetratricopeptide (TPR) repeat protein
MASTEILLAQIKSLVSQGRKADALSLLERAISEQPDNPSLLLWYAGLTPDIHKSIELLERVLQIEPDNLRAQEGLKAQRARLAQIAPPSPPKVSQPQAGVPQARLDESGARSVVHQVTSAAPQTTSAVPEASPGATSVVHQVTPATPQATSAVPEATPVVSSPGESLTSSHISGQEIIRFAEETIWTFRDLNEPIGKLMQEGKITSKDLVWASENARNLRIRWAAAVCLHRNDIASSVLDVNALKKVIWPFKNLNRPIINLLEEKAISVRDLAYAVANAKDKSLIQAAAGIGYLLLTERIQVLSSQQSTNQSAPPKQETEPERRPVSPGSQVTASEKRAESPKNPGAKRNLPSSKGSLNIVTGSGYLYQSQKALQKKASSMRKIGMSLITMAIIVSFFGFLSGSYFPMSIALSILGIAYLIALGKEKLKREEENFARGIQGEESLAQALRQRLDGEWTLFRNVDLPDHAGDLDAVLVGPKGVYLLEVKAYNFTCRNRNDQWEFRSFARWKPLSKNPTQQALRNAARLNDYLKQIVGHDIWIEPRIVWAGKSKLFLEKPRVKVWYLNQPDSWMKEINNGQPLPSEKLNLILVSLRTLCSVNRS